MTAHAQVGAAEASGYAHPAYVASLAEWGAARLLPRSGGWLLERPIAGQPLRDAMGPYPLFACRDWTALGDDLESIGRSLVSVALVADPFGPPDAEVLRRCFDRVVALKQHFVVDLGLPPGSGVDRHHRRSARLALREVRVDRVEDPPGFAPEWWELYQRLIDRHAIRGLPAFSRAALTLQLGVPGITVLRARREGETVGATLWYRQGDVIYYHLGAYTDAGYQTRASFALFWTALEWFTAAGARWLDLGGAAGAGRPADDDGLARFKRGWSTVERTAYFCGRVFDAEAYQRLTGGRDPSGAPYFPAYRAGEFA